MLSALPVVLILAACANGASPSGPVGADSHASSTPAMTSPAEGTPILTGSYLNATYQPVVTNPIRGGIDRPVIGYGFYAARLPTNIV